MLDLWIIESLRKREDHDHERPQLELPLELPLLPPAEEDGEQEVREQEEKRGVIVIDFSV